MDFLEFPSMKVLELAFDSDDKNFLGTLGDNWKWRLNENAINEGLIWHMNLLAGMYSRKK